MHPEGNPEFAISDKTDRDIHYIVTYLAKLNNGSFGADLSGSEPRRKNFEKAIASKQPVASSTLIFDTFPKDEQEGFVITMPVYNKSQSDAPLESVGVVNAVFSYGLFFKDVFNTNDQLLNDVSMTVTDTTDGKQILNNDRLSGDPSLTKVELVSFAGKQWEVEINAKRYFGVSQTQQKTSLLLALFIEAVGGLLIVVLYLQIRSKERAYRLADAMTEDLRLEKNRAVALQTRSDAILQSIGDGVFVIDMQQNVILMNKTAEQITGYTSAQALGKHYSQTIKFVSEDTHAEYKSFIEQALQGTVNSMADGTLLRHRDGHYIPVADSAAPILVGDKKVPAGAVVVFRDITQEKALDRAKDDFVSLASHQLSTPATAVKQFLGLVLENYAGELQKEQQMLVQKAYNNNEEQLLIVQDLLETARIDSGTSTLSLEQCNLHDMLQDIIASEADHSKKQSVTVRSNVAHDLTISADAVKLKMALGNLINNAIKYNKKDGTITLSAEKSNNTITITVADRGIGIKKDDINKLFSRFTRISTKKTSNIVGTGLGLYMVKKIVELHGGTVSVVSEEGKGTAFMIKIPQKGKA